MNPQIQDEIEQLKKEKGAIILAHYYTRPEVQQLADFTGDSLELSRKAKETKARIILFAGVKFMAETAAILSPEKIVLLPEGNPGCSLADSLTAEALRKWRKNFPDAVVVSYVNSTAAVKAESDYCCTSGNAVNVLKAIAAEKTILFCPDAQLGAWAANAAGRKAELWQGGCHVHVAMNRNLLITMANRYPDNEILMHPEALCAVEIPEALKNRTYIYSTSGMIQHAKNSRSSNFLIVTEPGILYELQKQNPGKIFIAIDPFLVCEGMKSITPEKLLDSLKTETFIIKIDETLAERALRPISRMIAINR